MAKPETLIERLIPGDLEHQIPAAMNKVLPGGFKNRLVQIALGALITFGFSFAVRRMLEKRESRREAPAEPRLESRPPPRFAEPIGAMPPAQPMANPAPLAEGSAMRHALLATPHIHLSGAMDQAMYASFRAQCAAAPPAGPLVIALSTIGGDPLVAQLMADDLRLLRETTGRELRLLGKVAIDTMGAAFIAGFPIAQRFLTHGTRLMLRERSLDRSIALSGPLPSCISQLTATLHDLEEAARIEEAGFRALIAGSRLSLAELRQRAASSGYLEAGEARDLGLVHAVI